MESVGMDLNGSNDSGVTSEENTANTNEEDSPEIKLQDGDRKSPRKRRRVFTVSSFFKDALTKTKDDDGNQQAYCEKSLKMASENLRGYKSQLQEKLAKLNQSREVRDKDRLISRLTARLCEMEATTEKENESIQPSDAAQGLMATIKEIRGDNGELKTQLAEQDHVIRNLKKENQRLKDELYQNSLQKIIDGHFVKQIQELQEDCKRLKLELYETEDKASAKEHELRKENDNLNMKLSDAILQSMSNHEKYRAWMAETLVDKELKIEKMNIEMDKKSRPTVEASDLQAVMEQLAQVRSSQHALRSLATMMPSQCETMVKQTGRKISEGLKAISDENRTLTHKYLKEMRLRKKFHNELVELKGNIRVFCRVRPKIKIDGEDEDEIVVTSDPEDDTQVKVVNADKGRTQTFDLDRVFGQDTTQDEMFREVSSLVRSAIDGYNVCIFAYGQTGSGKTYTMEGSPSSPGINQRALQMLFEETTELSEADSTDWQYDVSASVLEIYNESIRDLQNPDPQNKLEVKMKPEGGLHVPGLVAMAVTGLAQINQVFETGRRNRAVASTNMNHHSSRSHCLLMVTVRGHNTTSGATTTGRLNLVDLAGSERVAKSNADGDRLREAQNINRSLACLGDVIHALRGKHSHIPFRNSKLTYLLQDSLGGDSKTLMIVQVAPVQKNAPETVCSLTFGQRVRCVENGMATRTTHEAKSDTCGPQGTPSSRAGTPGTPSSRRGTPAARVAGLDGLTPTGGRGMDGRGTPRSTQAKASGRRL